MRIELGDVSNIGRDLHRPEGVMVARDGAVWAADGRGACTRIEADGSGERRVGDIAGEPNGICFDASGRLIVANLASSVQRLDPATGRHETIATEASGRRTATPNFPFADRQGRIWVSNSSDKQNLAEAFSEAADDGFLFRIEADGRAVVVAEGLHFANGVAVDVAERWVYVAESTRFRVMRFPIADDGLLGGREQFGPEIGTAPDGIAFDEAGNLWVTCPGTNQVGFLTPSGDWRVVLEDTSNRILRLPTNICFGGRDRRTAYLGNLDGKSLVTFRVPHPGMALVHQL